MGLLKYGLLIQMETKKNGDMEENRFLQSKKNLNPN